MPDGKERPIGFASRTLSSAEQNYSQLEKAGLSYVFGVRKFHSYLFGYAFELITDHKTLLALINEHRPTSPQASARIRRWSLFLSTYEYSLAFRPTEAHCNVDALSRLPLASGPAEVPTPQELVLLVEHLADSPVTAGHIRSWTQKDPVQARVLEFVRQGRPGKVDQDLSQFFAKKEELARRVYFVGNHGGCSPTGARVGHAGVARGPSRHLSHDVVG